MNSVMEYDLGTFLNRNEQNHSEISRRTLGNMMKGVVGSGVSLGLYMAQTVVNFATSTTVAPAQFGTGNNKKDAKGFINDLQNTDTYKNDGVENFGNKAIGFASSGFSMVRTLVLIAVLIACLVAIVKLGSGSGQGQNDGKSGLVKGAMALFGIGALAALIGLLYNIGSSAFSLSENKTDEK